MLTGRITASPSTLLQDEILDPQFSFEATQYLQWYVLIEKVLLLEYERMNLIEREAVRSLGSALTHLTSADLTADPRANMSDITFAIERFVEQEVDSPIAAWHVDRSRNDLQACAQLLWCRHQLLDLVDDLLDLVATIHRASRAHIDVAMPGYTHYQAAQVISPAFYLAAVSEHILRTMGHLRAGYDAVDACPLGAGAMAGQHLPWDRARMATLLGFSRPETHALVAVASREWALRIAADLSNFAVGISRFVTDLMQWGGSQYGFIELPDDLAGISSAMPQKRNYPILERIRGKTAHISGYYVDFLFGQRNTPYTNLVEVSKESGSQLTSLFATTRSVLRLFGTVIESMRFRAGRMGEVCEREYLGGFALANLLTLQEDIPYRTAQVMTGQYIVAAMERGLAPHQADCALLQEICRRHGHRVNVSDELIRDCLDVDRNLRGTHSMGSSHPAAVHELLTWQEEELDGARTGWLQCRLRAEDAYRDLDARLFHD